MVRGVARGREALEPEQLGTNDVDVLLRHRCELAPERVELVAVEPARAALQPRRVDEMRRSDLGDVDLQPRVLSDERSRGSGVI